ncbi:TrkH family potassium uptake protein [Paenarthrobacter aurescens]|uniref:Potassium transporter Trk n=1 Tax=Paenarthrobacter aurescens TaxID=43663 RepID=A0A4Y3N941_PAEAU|nr:potassium transporter TrkG [Paenarthrobacter aurescens]MDO6144566.1 TrkH family potassium uptake protein [Paenarthrobacter aurescens]MDO6148411.1 TrkH family potassium uptake protein [Paenarthrobacter aurescens]MDO6159657.1 TrkH family potassium uptake protein [Paenarthrobacter aurescens]MDO6164559.1 TrkH family potassium uptake protein [Paenarthrobacter aurescens]GEB17773.1 potassium transporter Trk [Paenarthrobacter aurescens]
MTRAPEKLPAAERSLLRHNPVLQSIGREGERLKTALLHPVRSVPLAFLAVIILGALILMLPISRTGEGEDVVTTAFFTAVSSVCVTGLITVDTATYWTPFGHAVILGLIQVGGFGIMSLATLLALFVRKTIGLRGQLVAQSETHTLNFGDVKSVLFRVLKIMVFFEAATALVLTARFWVAYDNNILGTALWHGMFHAVSAFNNAGFALYSDNLIGFAEDPWIIVPICAAIIAGGLGFPVIIQLMRDPLRFRNWTIHLRLTVYGSLLLLTGGIALFAAFEWNRAETLGPLSFGGKILGSLAGGVFPRTAGFNSIDYGVATPETLMVTNVLMFIGGGSAGTAGGIKITTFLVLGFAIWNEVRGREQVTIAHRSISSSTQRQALTVALLGVGAVILGTMLLLITTDYSLEKVLFETISAFGTVGLSTGITYNLPPTAEWVLMALMFTGRIGTITVASAIALASRPRLFQLPEERPIIG